MKIVFLNIFNGVIERGSEIFVEELASRLGKHHQVVVFQTGVRKKANYQIKLIKGIPPIFHQRAFFLNCRLSNFLSEVIYYFLVFVFTLKALPFLWQEKFDWIIPINGPIQGVFCRLLKFFRGGKILVSGHAGMGREERLNFFFTHPDVFVALTKGAFLWAKKNFSPEKVYYIPNGVDTVFFHPDIPPKKLFLAKPLVLSVSALLPYKRVELLIRAVKEVPKLNLLVIGDGPKREDVFCLGKSLLGKRFTLIPSVSHEEIPHYYRAANLFSLPSQSYEAFGLVYLEALACNLPVVAPDDLNRREIIGRGGIYCRVEDKNKYAAALRKALKINFGDKPRKQALKFSWEKIVRQYERILAKG